MPADPLPTSDAPAGSPVVADGLRRTYRAPGGDVCAVDDVSLAVRRGTITAITGRSGSGKTTLLQLLAGLDRPDAGRVWIDGTEITGLGDRRLAAIRRRHVGFVFQAFNLVPSLSARDNMTLPTELDGRAVAPGALEELAELLGIADRLDHLPGQLSGGQQQRVAVARAVLAEPAVIFADEPTGALDDEAGAALLTLFAQLSHERGQTIVVVTHDRQVAAAAGDVWVMQDGRLTASAGVAG